MLQLFLMSFMISFVSSITFALDEEIMDKQAITRYYNGFLLRSHELINEDLWVENGKIVAPQKKADHEIDLKGQIIAPGYIDLQINGGFGVDFSNEPEKVEIVANKLPQYGVTAFLPTLISSDSKTYKRNLNQIKSKRNENQAEILGIHLEGPFFSSEKVGAHNPHLIRTFEQIDSIDDFYGNLDHVKIVTLAPELAQSSSIISYLKGKNIIVSAGHTNADYETTEKGVQEGISMATHLFNAMPPLHHRTPGVVNAFLTNPNLFYSIIVDKVHVHPAMVHLAWRANPDGLILVTDAIAALGKPQGEYFLGGQEVVVDETTAFVKGTSTLAGSILSMDAAVRNFKDATNCTLIQAIECASLKPAKLLGIDSYKGTLNVGADADFIILDEDLFVQACYIAGKLAFKKN